MKVMIQKTGNGFIVSPPLDGSQGVHLDQIKVLEGHDYDRLWAVAFTFLEPETARKIMSPPPPSEVPPPSHEV